MPEGDEVLRHRPQSRSGFLLMRLSSDVATLFVMTDVYLTSAGLSELERELARLRASRTDGESRVSDAMQLAGDAGDVGEYLDAQREQDMLDQRIDVLTERLSSAQLLDTKHAPRESLGLGSWADLEDLDTGEQTKYELVSSAESNPAQGRISVDSPVGRALFGHRPGETIEVLTPKGRRRHLKLLAVRPD
jgi:transcription elongation factor GreA